MQDFQESQYADDLDVNAHNFLAHYIIDGHHKAYAAALEGKEITMLSYIRKNNYFCNYDTFTVKKLTLLDEPNTEHELYRFLSIAADKSQSIEERKKALAVLSEYLGFDKVEKLLIDIASCADEGKELVVLASTLIAKIIQKTFWKKLEYESFRSLTPHAIEIIQKVIEGK